MRMLTFGLLVWIAVHLFPSIASSSRQQLVERLGNIIYQSIFSLLLVASLLLIVFGWRNTVPSHLYTPPDELHLPAMLLVVIGFILMVAANFPTRIKQVIRHPQLTGVLLWAVAHLLLNGDSRSVIVFSALGAWCVVSILTINRRDGAWVKPEVQGKWGREAIIVVIGLVLSLIIGRFHYFLSGVQLMG
ncbi:MAG: NnrU family protein [Gammaproteobacteria bacterium]|nr:NnrU family protein [Gammaproteobacteria bacterium]MDH3561080.1 NnrU family protein [Gammaproteobacteria bacterium]